MDFRPFRIPRNFTPPFSNFRTRPSEVPECISSESPRMVRVLSRWIRHPGYSGMWWQAGRKISENRKPRSRRRADQFNEIHSSHQSTCKPLGLVVHIQGRMSGRTQLLRSDLILKNRPFSGFLSSAAGRQELLKLQVQHRMRNFVLSQSPGVSCGPGR